MEKNWKLIVELWPTEQKKKEKAMYLQSYQQNWPKKKIQVTF